MNNARLATRLLGSGNVLVIHRLTLDLVGGDHLAALFLEQLLYWTERTKNKDGWIVKTYAEWERELRLSKYLVGRIAETLAPLGVETTVRRSPFHNMQPVVHYRVDLSVLGVKIQDLIDSEEISLSSESENFLLSNESEKSSRSITETTPETTAEVMAPPRAEPMPVRLLRNDTVASMNGWQLIAAYGEAVNIPGETLWSAPKSQNVAAALARAAITPDDIRAFLEDLRKQPDRFNGYRFNYLAEDLPRWKQLQAEKPKPHIVSDIERAAQEQALEAERQAWRKEQGLL